MQRNDALMLAIFEFFHERPELIYVDASKMPEIFRTFSAQLSHDQDVILWHLAVFFDEFVVDRATLDSFQQGRFGIDKLTPYLNWSGQCFYEKLKQGVQNQPNQE